MTDATAPNGFGSLPAPEKTPFEKQRDSLIGQITQVSRLPTVSLIFPEHGANNHKYEPSQPFNRGRYRGKIIP